MPFLLGYAFHDKIPLRLADSALSRAPNKCLLQSCMIVTKTDQAIAGTDYCCSPLRAQIPERSIAALLCERYTWDIGREERAVSIQPLL